MMMPVFHVFTSDDDDEECQTMISFFIVLANNSTFGIIHKCHIFKKLGYTHHSIIVSPLAMVYLRDFALL